MIAINSDQLLADLDDDDLPQGVSNATQFEPEEVDPLEELLAEVMSDAAERAQYQDDLKARKRSFVGMTKEEVDFCNSRMQVFDQAKTWKPVRNLAVFTRFHCLDCGEVKLVFTRFMQAQVSRTNPTAKRWDTILKPDAEVPTVTAVERRDTSICPVCAVGKGLDTHSMIDLQEALK